MDEYTPATGGVRGAYAITGVMAGGTDRKREAEFDRWHTADRFALIRELAFSGYFGTNAQSNLLRIAEIVAKGGEVPKV